MIEFGYLRQTDSNCCLLNNENDVYGLREIHLAKSKRNIQPPTPAETIHYHSPPLKSK